MGKLVELFQRLANCDLWADHLVLFLKTKALLSYNSQVASFTLQGSHTTQAGRVTSGSSVLYCGGGEDEELKSNIPTYFIAPTQAVRKGTAERVMKPCH